MVHSEKPAPRKRGKPGASTGTPPVEETSARTATSPQTSKPGGSDSEANALDEARKQKIAGIKKALEEGTYHVSNEEIARKVIEHMFEPKK